MHIEITVSVRSDELLQAVGLAIHAGKRGMFAQ